MSQSNVLLQTNVPNVPVKRGKVRDIYDLGDRLLIVATDRISAFDVVMPNGIPDKGKILTSLSLFWFDLLKDKIHHHLISADVKDLPAPFDACAEQLAGRFMLVRKAEVVPIECVVRGYLAGSGWQEYEKQQTVCRIELPAGLARAAKLPEPLFTPATKATSGHDENISPRRAAELVGNKIAEFLEKKSIEVYKTASDYAATRGVIIADTKFEFGAVDGEMILVDEVLTPDSSRFWLACDYRPGADPDPLDKQYTRNYLETLDWDKTPPGPTLPDDVVKQTRARYAEAYRLITGNDF